MNFRDDAIELDLKKARFSLKAIFLVCGIGISSWAPMVPYTKDRLGLDDGRMGVLLLFLGAGAIILMPISGWLISKIGSLKTMIASAVVMSVALPLLLLMDSSVAMAAMLFVFGAGLGSIDVAMNAHGVQIQNLSEKPIMSSIHGFFSVGGLVGPLAIGLLIKLGITPLMAAISVSGLMMLIVLTQFRFLMDAATEVKVNRRFAPEKSEESSGGASWLNAQVLFLGAMCFAVFLAEGAMLDWSAIFLRDNRGVEEALSGVGYAAFSVAMAVMRLVGDKVVSKLDTKTVVSGGAFVGVAGFALIVGTPWLIGAFVGFVLVGIGAANIVPVFFSEGGRLKNVPSSVALAAITSMGYAGQLAGPAILGFIAQQTSLSIAFGFTGFLLLLVGIAYGRK
ncbi:MFS transporter [Runella limosa]|uniref:MFS transporter n=1 Tax=Runella limosa TaxID=370978 RepID=UPI000402EDC0|nr:MFS transporter [Runella limosa]